MKISWILLLNNLCLFLPHLHCLSYIEKGMLDRLLTYYDEKVRPADKRNFLADPNSPPVVINASLAVRHMTYRDGVLTLDLELYESWYDSRLQGSEKVRQRFQLPSDMRVWVPKGAPETNSKPSECQQRKLFISDTARLESQCRFVAQVDCKGDHTDFPFDSHACLVEIEAADSTDVSYLCDSCLESLDSSIAPPYFTVRSSTKTHSLSKSDSYTSLLDSLTTTTTSTTVAPRFKRRKPGKKGAKLRTAKKRKSPNFENYDYEEEDEEDAAGRMRLAIGRTIALKIVLTRSAAAYYVVTAMIPAVMLVMLAWISVFSHRKMVKITLQSTAIFALIVLWGNHYAVPTVTALDLWLLCCLCFVCASVLESSLLTCLPSIPRSSSRNSIAKRSDSATSVNRAMIMANDNRCQPNGSLFVHVEHCGNSVKRLVDQERIHLAFVVMYPIAFTVISLVLWLPRVP